MPLVIADLTDTTTTGVGAFDVLMVSMKAHLQEEFSAGRIHGKEYSTVYLGALTSVLDRALEFLLQKDKVELEALMIAAQTRKVKAEVLLINAEILNAGKSGLLVDAQTALAVQQKANLVLEGQLIPEQKLKIIAETALVVQNKLNAVIEGEVLTATKCKLQAEFDVLVETKTKTIAETSVLNQKKVTEQAQTNGADIDAGSVIGKQLALYGAQTDGFKRDAEQKAAQLLISVWNTSRTTDEGTVRDGTNMLDDTAIGRAVTKLFAGIAA